MSDICETPLIQKRISELEHDVGSIKTDVAALSVQMESNSRVLSSLGAKIDALVTHIGQAGRADWKTVISAVALAVTIGTLALAPMYRDLSRLDSEVKNHVALEGHDVALEKHRQITDRVGQIDTVLQREMRLIAQRIDSETSILERQMLELRAKAGELAERVTKVESRG